MAYIYPLEDFKKNWEASPLIVFDTNSFLNLYRYTPETTEHILSVLKSISKDQFWLPNQVIQEYSENHGEVIRKEHSKYKEVTREVERVILITENDIAKQFKKYNKFKFPLVKELEGKIQNAITSIKEEAAKYKDDIKQEVKRNERMLKEDKVKEFVDDLILSDCIGAGFNLSEMLGIFSEGELRYNYKIPPGYMDEDKDKTDVTKRRKFGDLILWKELLGKAKDSKVPIIFVTMDEKEDWWVLDKDKNPIRPREELIEEFKEHSEVPFALMSLPNFVNHVSVINDTPDMKSYLEMNALSICKNLIDMQGWEDILSGKSELSYYLIHSGAIQDWFDNVVSDVDADDYSEPEITITSVDLIEDEVFIEADFEAKVGANITLSFSENYSSDEYAVLTVSGSISLEFKVDLEEEADFINTDDLNIRVGGFDILECEMDYYDNTALVGDEDRCRDCGNPNTSYHMKNGEAVCENCSSCYETCPHCGRLFEHGTLGGAFCNHCEIEREQQD